MSFLDKISGVVTRGLEIAKSASEGLRNSLKNFRLELPSMVNVMPRFQEMAATAKNALHELHKNMGIQSWSELGAAIKQSSERMGMVRVQGKMNYAKDILPEAIENAPKDFGIKLQELRGGLSNIVPFGRKSAGGSPSPAGKPSGGKSGGKLKSAEEALSGISKR